MTHSLLLNWKRQNLTTRLCRQEPGPGGPKQPTARHRRHNPNIGISNQRPPGTPPGLSPRLPKPDQLCREITAGIRRIQTEPTPSNLKSPFTDEPGGYIWYADELESQSVFTSEGPFATLVEQSWERFKFGGRASAQQLALFVALKELPNNKFGTQSAVYWDDAYFRTQVGAHTYGTYSVHIVDPILFAKKFVPASYLQAQDVFDFTDRTNAAASQLFAEVIGSLSTAFSSYANSSERGNRITNIQQDAVRFADSLSQAVEGAYRWTTTRGLAISNVTILGIRYDEATQELLRTVQRADALTGSRGNANLQASVAAGIEAAGGEPGSGGIVGMGLSVGSMDMVGIMQKAEPNGAYREVASPGGSDLFAQLEGLKRAFEAGLIDQADFDAAKAKALGL